ncbi:MAG: AIR synthase-related protein, partial [Acetivibrio sp.]
FHKELNMTLGEALLTPTKIYVNAFSELKKGEVRIKACSHITGGGFYENVPRMLPEGMHAMIQKDSYPIPPIFKMLAREGNIEEEMMYNTYNMGIGMIVVVDKEDVKQAKTLIEQAGERAFVIGEIKAGEKGVTLC